MKCDICGEKIKEIFLNKPLGTIIRNKKGKKKSVCSECQSKLSKDDMLEKL